MYRPSNSKTSHEVMVTLIKKTIGFDKVQMLLQARPTKIKSSNGDSLPIYIERGWFMHQKKCLVLLRGHWDSFLLVRLLQFESPFSLENRHPLEYINFFLITQINYCMEKLQLRWDYHNLQINDFLMFFIK